MQILRYEKNKIINVSVEYPELIEQDALYWLAHITKEKIELTDFYTQVTAIKKFQSSTQDDPETEKYVHDLYLATYMADMCVIGKCEDGWQTYYEYCEMEHTRDICVEYAGTIQKALDDLLNNVQEDR